MYAIRSYYDPDAMRQLGKEENVPVIDLNAMTKVFYETLGIENSKHALVP